MTWIDWRALLVVASLLGALTYFYVQSQPPSPNIHAIILNRIEDINAYRAQLKKDLLLARIGILQNYTVIDQDMKNLSNEFNKLSKLEHSISGQADITQQLQIISTTLSRQTALIEHYTTDNQTLRRSIADFTLGVHGLCESIAKQGKGLTGPALIASDLSHHVLQYVNEPTSQSKQNVEIRLKELEAATTKNSSAEIQNLLRNARLIDSLTGKVDATLRELTAGTLRQQLGAFQAIYLQHYSNIVIHTKNYRLFLYAVSVILLAYLLYFFTRLRLTTFKLIQTNSVLEQEVMERKQAAKALKESEIKYRALVEHIPAITYTAELDEFSTTRFVSPQIEKILDVSPEEAEQSRKFWYDHLYSGDRDRVMAQVKETQQGGKPLDCEYRLVKSNGDVIWVRDVAAVVTNEAGKPLYLQGVMLDITERKLAQQSLVETEERNRLLLESTGEGIYGVDLEGICTFVNPACLRILGYQEQKELLGKNIHELIHHTRTDGSPYPGRECRVYQAYRRGEGTHVDDEILWRNDGKSFPTEYWSYPIKRNDQTVGAVVTFVDITERKQSEEALRKSEARLAEAQKVARLGNWELDVNTGELIWSEESRQILGIPPDVKADKKALLAVVVDEDKDKVIKAIDDAMHGKKSCDIEYRAKHYDGLEHVIHCRGGLQKTVLGNPTRMLGVAQDITEQKRAEEAQRRYAERLEVLDKIDKAILAARSSYDVAKAALQFLQHLITMSRASVTLFDLETETATILAVEGVGQDDLGTNKQMPIAETFGSLDDLKNGEIRHFKDAELTQHPNKLNQSLKKLGIHTYLNVPLIVKNELIGTLNLGASDIEAYNHEHITIAREVADSLAIAIQQARLNEQVKFHTEELEQRVTERTAQLAAAFNELEAFSYSVSHDLRAPLRSINGFSMALLEDYEDKLDEYGKNYLQRIRTASDHMGQLIDDLLKLSRVTRTDMQRQAVDLSSIAQSISITLQQSQPDRRVTFKIQKNAQVQGDPSLLRIVMENLLNNAWKFSKNKAPTVIEFGFKDGDKEREFYVRDNGAGFDMNYVDKLFKPFQRLHSPHEFEGTGIGLATVRRIVERHGGRVWAEGEIDKGATIYFALPIKKVL